MPKVASTRKTRLPESFRPLLWGLRWNALDVNEDKEDIIMGAVNEGTLDHWRWIIKTYGRGTIRRVLERRLVSEFHPESRRLAEVVFSVRQYREAR